MDIVLITSEDMDGYSDIQEYADDLYDYCDYGYGANRDGLLLLISMAERDWYISTCGYGITAFTDAGISYLGSAMKEDLSSGNYASAFYTYASECDQMITMAREGHPFSKKDLPHAPLSPLVLPICIVIEAGKGQFRKQYPYFFFRNDTWWRWWKVLNGTENCVEKEVVCA